MEHWAGLANTPVIAEVVVGTAIAEITASEVATSEWAHKATLLCAG